MLGTKGSSETDVTSKKALMTMNTASWYGLWFAFMFNAQESKQSWLSMSYVCIVVCLDGPEVYLDVQTQGKKSKTKPFLCEQNVVLSILEEEEGAGRMDYI